LKTHLSKADGKHTDASRLAAAVAATADA